MAKARKDKDFIKKPVYKGGLPAMRQFLKEHLKYPPAALENKIEGTVYLKYTLDYKGKVISTKVISSLGYGCDQEAERLVRLFKFKAPKNRGLKVKFHKSIQIHFRLAHQATKPTVETIRYNYTSTKPQKTASKTPNTYTISIKINS